MVGEARQVALETGQGVGDQAGGATHAQQMFQQRLIALCAATLVLAGIGEDGLVGLQEALAFDDRHVGAIHTETGIVMVGQHQRQPRQMHDVGISQPIALCLRLPLQQGLGDTACLGAPRRCDGGQLARQIPVRRRFNRRGARIDFVPVVGDFGQRGFQPDLSMTLGAGTDPGLALAVFLFTRHAWKTVMGDDQQPIAAASGARAASSRNG